MFNEFKRFLQMEAAGGIILLIAASLALICANSPLESLYKSLLNLPVEIHFGALHLAKPLLLWINDGLMAIFFLLVGLELKREFLDGELSRFDQLLLPGLGALGGMLIPALLYILMNYHDPIAVHGWAIPAATDIAFALGILMLLGSRVPPSLKAFLVALAILDDIGAIIIIALFYTSKLSHMALGIAGTCCIILFIFNRLRISTLSPYLLTGLVMWVAVLKSGIHATLAGVILALFIPMTTQDKRSPVRDLEHDLHSLVAFFVLPLFAFANAGVPFLGTSLDNLTHSVPVGVFLGLFIGKQAGIMLFCGLAIILKLASLPKGATWKSFYGTAILCGIGFTMSLFIGGLAFEDVRLETAFDERIGILFGSLLSGVLGVLLLHHSLPRMPKNKE